MQRNKKLHLKSRITAFMMALLLCIVELPMASSTVSASTGPKWTENAAGGFAGGSGTQEDPFQITTAAELALLAKENGTYSANHFRLMNDIDLSAYEWVPMANFSGTFDGNGNRITGLRIGTAEEPATDITGDVGLFAYVSGTVKDLTVNAAIYVSDAVAWKGTGIVAGNLHGTLDHCVAEGIIDATRTYTFLGGLAGTVSKGGRILNCGNKASVKGSGSADAANVTRVGGIAGSLVIGSSETASLLVANCYNVGTVMATGGHTPYAGGILGWVQNNAKDQEAYQISVYNCYNAGVVDITGSSNKGRIGNIAAYTTGKVNTGCLYGIIDTLVTDDDVETVTTCNGQEDLALTEMQAAAFSDTLQGTYGVASFTELLNKNVENLTNTGIAGLLHWQAVADATPVTASGAVVPETATLTITVIGSEYGSVAVAVNDIAQTGTSPYVIEKGSKVEVTFIPGTDCERVVAPEGSVEQEDGSYVYTINSLDEDTALTVEFIAVVHISNEKWTDHAATAFAGGEGSAENPYQITEAAQLALLAKENGTYGANHFQLMNDIDLSAYEWVPIANCSGTFDGNGKRITGLRIGTAEAPVTDITGDVGLFAYVSGTVKDLTVNAAIYVSDAVAWKGSGIVAGNLHGTLDHCFAEGIIDVARTYTFLGGLAGSVSKGGRIINCANKASVKGSGSSTIQNVTRVGGIAGSLVIGSSETASLLLANCYNVGTVTATGGHTPYAGGIIGWVQNNAKDQDTYQISVYNCYNAGVIDITGSSNKGKIGNITPYTTGKINAGYLYGITDTLVTDADVTMVATCTGQEDLALEKMKEQDFAEDLALNADVLVGQGICEKVLLGWQAVAGATPTFSDTLVKGTMVGLSVTVNSSRLGSVTVKADQTGGTDYVEVKRMILEKNSRVQLTILPKTGCQVKTLTLNGEAQSIQGNTFEFVLTEATEVEVAFEVESTINADPVYVDPSADAQGDGTISSPFQNLEQAKAKVRTILETMPNANITIYLRGGSYVLEETFALGEEDSSFGRITYKNYGDERPVITSGHSINGTFTKVEGKEYYSYQLPESAKVGEEGAKTWPQFRDLYVNGERATLARTEELTYKYTYANSVYGSATSATTVTSCDNKLYVSAAALEGITDEELTFVELGQLVEWQSQIFHIGSRTGVVLDGTEAEITFNQDEWDLYYVTDKTKKSLVGRTYWLQNHINFLDAPGEFYYDRSAGTIYYYPLKGQDMSSAAVEYATLDTLIRMENAANITFDGIAFTGTTANYISEHGLATMLGATLCLYEGDDAQHMPFSAIQGNYAEGIQIKNCTFEELSGSAVIFHCGIKDLQVSGNVIRNIAMAGIQVGRNQLWWNQDGIPGASEDVTIENNYITNIGTITFGAPAIRVARSKNLKIRYNKIVHVPYSAIMTGIGWNVSPTDEGRNTNLVNADISYNYIEDYLYKINDGGAIYTCGANNFVSYTETMNAIHHNYVRAGGHNGTYTGIYHDGSASNWHTYSNVIDDLKSKKGPMFFQDDVPSQYSHNILAENNYTTVSPISQNGDKDSDGNPRNIVLKNNTMFKDRSKLNAEAAAIVNGAGLQDAYKHLESPMDVELRIADNTMHYEVNKKQEGDTAMQIELTNNSAVDQVFTLSVSGSLPNGIALLINEGNAVTVPAKGTVIVNAKFVITNADKVVDTEDYIAGFEVTDAAGRVVPYPRTFTIKTFSGNVAGEIPYGTPTVDGTLDDAYLNGIRYSFGSVFYPSVYEETEINGGYYLLWDENYLYCYIIVNEPTIMSRGTEWITEQVESGQQGKLWETDAVETYIKVPSIRGGQSKFAVDAFGIQRFGNDKISLEHHNLPYATKFTYNDEIIDQEIPATIAAGQTASEAMGTDVTGYVVEMTLPITLMESIIGSADGKPSAGDIVEFYIQNNDYRGLKSDGSVYVVAQANEMSTYTLKAKENPDPGPTPGPDPDPTPGPDPDPDPDPTPGPDPTPDPDPTPSGDQAEEQPGESTPATPGESANTSTSPKTGDIITISLWLLFVLCAVGAGISVIIFLKKKED